MAVPRGDARPVRPARRRLGGERARTTPPSRLQALEAALQLGDQPRRPRPPLRPRQPLRQRRLPRCARERRGIVASMSRKGDCWDNAVAESFFATLKAELVDNERYATRAAPTAVHRRLHRQLLQPPAAPLVPRLPQPHRVRIARPTSPRLRHSQTVHGIGGTPPRRWWSLGRGRCWGQPERRGTVCWAAATRPGQADLLWGADCIVRVRRVRRRSGLLRGRILRGRHRPAEGDAQPGRAGRVEKTGRSPDALSSSDRRASGTSWSGAPMPTTRWFRAPRLAEIY